MSKLKSGDFLSIIGKYLEQIFTAKNYLSNIKAMDAHRGERFFIYSFLVTTNAALRVSLIVTLSRLFNKSEEKTQTQKCKKCGNVIKRKMKQEHTIQKLLCIVEQNSDIFYIDANVVSEKVKEFQTELKSLEKEVATLKTRRDKVYSHNDFKSVTIDKIMLIDLEKLLIFADKVIKTFWLYTTNKEVNTTNADSSSDFNKFLHDMGVVNNLN